MLATIPLWLHIVAATIWVGSQVLLFAAVVPAVRRAPDRASAHEVLGIVTRRFGYIGFASLAVLVLTGVDNAGRYAPDDMFDFRYGYILATKVVLLAVVFLLTVLHTWRIGPDLLALQARELAGSPAPPEEIHTLRLRSISVTSLTLLLSLAILFCAALLRSPYAYGLA